MTDLLHEVMAEKAEALPPPTIDLARLQRDGERMIRRRRMTLLGAAVATVVAGGLAIPLVVPEPGADRARERSITAAFAAGTPTYAVGSVMHIGDRSFDVGRSIRAFVQTDAGVVFADPQGRVWAADGRSAVQVGKTDPRGPHLVADGPKAAWVQPRGTDAPPEFVVYDQVRQEGVQSSWKSVVGMGTLVDSPDPAVVYAIDGDVVYFRDSRGAVAWDVVTGSQRVLSADADGSTIDDVRNGLIAYTPPGQDQDGAPPEYRVGRDLASGTSMRLWTGYSLSPDGTYLLGERRTDRVAAFDVKTGREIRPPTMDYDYLGGYAWVDADTYAATGLRASGDGYRIDILTCGVGADCDLVREDVADPASGLALPIGEPIGE